jgi:hypothetical protein
MPTSRASILVFVTLLFSSALCLQACTDDGNGNGAPPGTGGTAAGAMSSAGTMSGAGVMNASGAGGAGVAGGGGGPVAGGGAGGVAGGAGGAGGSGGGAPMPVLPVMRDGLWAFDMGEVTLEVNAEVGGRITTFRLGTENLLTGPEVNATYWGSTLWTSPEADWQQPPPAPIDSAPYAAQVMGDKLVLTGQPYAMLGVSVTKTFWADPAAGAFKIEYKLNNTDDAPIQMAPWEVTRVFPRGLTFFPTGNGERLSNGATLPTTKSDGITWWAYDMANVTMDSKLWADGAEGWLAHVAQGLVFIKTFADVLPANAAPMESDVELYANAPAMAAGRYIELENQAAYGDIAPAASVSWVVTWYLRKLPDGMAPTPSAALAQFVRTTIAGM